MGIKIIVTNKKAYFDYEVLESIEVGLVLRGDEVKSIRQGKVSLSGSFATIHGGELFLLNCNISTYDKAYFKNEDESTRSRKLLIHKKQLMKLIGDISRKGITLVPLKLYFNEKSKVKIELGLCRHKKAAGKKEAIKERDIKRETARAIKDVRG